MTAILPHSLQSNCTVLVKHLDIQSQFLQSHHIQNLNQIFLTLLLDQGGQQLLFLIDHPLSQLILISFLYFSKSIALVSNKSRCHQVFFLIWLSTKIEMVDQPYIIVLGMNRTHFTDFSLLQSPMGYTLSYIRNDIQGFPHR